MGKCLHRYAVAKRERLSPRSSYKAPAKEQAFRLRMIVGVSCSPDGACARLRQSATSRSRAMPSTPRSIFRDSRALS